MKTRSEDQQRPSELKADQQRPSKLRANGWLLNYP